jgi:hypothetical protein
MASRHINREEEFNLTPQQTQLEGLKNRAMLAEAFSPKAKIVPHASFSPVFRRNPMRKNKAQVQNENEQDNWTDR